DANKADLIDECSDFCLCCVVIAGIEQHALPAVRLRIAGQDLGAKVVECLHDARAWHEIGKNSLDTRPSRSTGLNNGASIGLLASMTMRPFQSGSPANAAGNFVQLTAMKTT